MDVENQQQQKPAEGNEKNNCGDNQNQNQNEHQEGSSNPMVNNLMKNSNNCGESLASDESSDSEDESIEVVDAEKSFFSAENSSMVSGDDEDGEYFGEEEDSDAAFMMTTSVVSSYVNVSQQKTDEKKGEGEEASAAKMSLLWEGNTSQLLRSSTPLLLLQDEENEGASKNNEGGGRGEKVVTELLQMMSSSQQTQKSNTREQIISAAAAGGQQKGGVPQQQPQHQISAEVPLQNHRERNERCMEMMRILMRDPYMPSRAMFKSFGLNRKPEEGEKPEEEADQSHYTSNNDGSNSNNQQYDMIYDNPINAKITDSISCFKNDNNNAIIDWYRRQLDKRERQLEDAEKRCREYKSEADGLRKVLVDLKVVNNSVAAPIGDAVQKGKTQAEILQASKTIAELSTSEFGAIKAAFEELNKKLESYQRKSAEAFRLTVERFASLAKAMAENSSSTERNHKSITEKLGAFEEATNAGIRLNADQLGVIQRSIEAERINGKERMVNFEQALEKLSQRFEQTLLSKSETEGKLNMVEKMLGDELKAMKSQIAEIAAVTVQQQQQKKTEKNELEKQSLETTADEKTANNNRCQQQTSQNDFLKYQTVEDEENTLNKEKEENVQVPTDEVVSCHQNQEEQPKKVTEKEEEKQKITVSRSNTTLESVAAGLKVMEASKNKKEWGQKRPLWKMELFDSEEESDENEKVEYSKHYRMWAGMAKIRPLVMPFQEGNCRRYSLKSAFNGAFAGIRSVEFLVSTCTLIDGKGSGVLLVFEQLNKYAEFADCWMRRADDEEQYFVQLNGDYLISGSSGSYSNSQRFSATVVGSDEGGLLMRLSLLDDTENGTELDSIREVDRVVTVEEEGGFAWLKVVGRLKKRSLLAPRPLVGPRPFVARSITEREALKHRREELFYLASVP